MSMRIDELDAQIIELLQNNGRMMYKDIAAVANVSLPTAKARIKRLKELGVIKRFTVVLDSEMLWGRVRAFVLAKVNLLDIETLKEKAAQMAEVRNFYIVTGDRQAFLDLELEDIRDLPKFIAERLSKELGLSDFNILTISNVIKEGYNVQVKPYTSLRFRCDFRGAVIYGRPVVQYIDGVRRYFSGNDCAEAFKERVAKKK